MSTPCFRRPLRHASLAIALAGLAAACTRTATPPPSATKQPAPAASTAAASPHAGMAMHGDTEAMNPNAPMAQATAQVAGEFGTDRPVQVTLQVVDMMSGQPMAAEAFEVAHTERMHVLVLDPSLTDYSHVHAAPGTRPGEWTFAFTPKFNRPYRLWLDVKPVGGVQAFVPLLVNANGTPAPAERTLAQTATVDGLSATLSFDAPLRVGSAAMGHVQITRNGRPFAALEPVMGAYAHIVGVSDDWSTVAHVHPMGAEPRAPTERGGPAVDFHLEPQRAGFLKLFAQIRVDGRDVFLPFGVEVAPAGAASSKP